MSRRDPQSVTIQCLSHALALLGLLAPIAAHAQEAEQGPPAAQDSAGSSGEDLAKQLSNPIASLISVPFQENLDFGLGADDDGFRSTLNVQPVVPIALNADWNLIVRTILPVIYQDDVTGPGEDQFGLGDTVQSLFFSPRETGPSGIVWGAGPVFLYPSATSGALGGKKWGAGPTVVLLKQSGKNTIGFLGNHIWSLAGSDSRPDVSSTFMQPFFSHTTSGATTYGLNTEMTYDWLREQWTVPINVSVSQLIKLGDQPVSIGGGFKYYAEKPAGGPDWGVRLVFTLLFPK